MIDCVDGSVDAEFTKTELVNGSTAAVLMHHSRTAPGPKAGSGVGPSAVNTSVIITGLPSTGFSSVAFGLVI